MKKSQQDTSKKQGKEKDTIVGEIMQTDFALQEAMEDAGMEAQTYGIWGFFWRFYKRFGERKKQRVNKKNYIWLLILTGWIGGHRFYARRYYLGALYLVFCWTFIPVMMSFIDLMEVIPIKKDEYGYIVI